jgi:hypothetical protein
MLAIDFAKVENKHQYHLELLVPHLLQLLFPSVPNPCASSTSKRKLNFASSQQSLSVYLADRAFQNTFSNKRIPPPVTSANLVALKFFFILARSL